MYIPVHLKIVTSRTSFLQNMLLCATKAVRAINRVAKNETGLLLYELDEPKKVHVHTSGFSFQSSEPTCASQLSCPQVASAENFKHMAQAVNINSK